MKRMVSYYSLAKEELGKVIFPTREHVRNAAVSVVVVVSVITLFLALLDLILSSSVSSIL